MKLSSFIFAGTLAWGVSMAVVSAQGQLVDDLSCKPTRLPNVGESVVESRFTSEAVTADIAAEGRTRQSAAMSARISATTVEPRPWLQSTTAIASSAKACQKLEQAKVEFHSKAWLSAEQSTWESISLFSQAIDLRGGGIDAGNRFRIAKAAIVEARDFGGSYATTDSEALFRLAKSHSTDLITINEVDGLTAAAAADRYLDLARRNLAPIAAQDPRCAEAIDFLAAIYLGRGEPKQLPGETALCLRRAALQGQPANADLAARLGMQLADVGLVDEAKWAMEHSLQIHFQPVVANRLAALMQHTGQAAGAEQWKGQVEVRSRFREGVALNSGESDPALPSRSSPVNERSPIPVPVIAQLSPSEFASVSKPVMQQDSLSTRPAKLRSKAVVPVSFASTRLDELNQSLHAKPKETPAVAETETNTANPVRRWFQSIRTPWRSTSK